MQRRDRFLDYVVRNRFNSENVKRAFRQRQKRHLDERPQELKGVYNGQFYRVPLYRPKRLIPTVPQIPFTYASPFCAFKPVYARHNIPAGPKSQTLAAKISSFFDRMTPEDSIWRFKEWWKKNWTAVIMNLGSICTLIGFTRSDVLELRAFNLAGNVAALLLNVRNNAWSSAVVVWSATFASVNFLKMMQIVDERQASVHLNEAQEQVYTKFFMPHGVTPKQFEAMDKKAKVVHIKRGDCLLRKNEKFDHVYLIVHGMTRANIAGRYLTAISFSVDHFETKLGGASGAWVGEMSFLHYYWNKEAARRKAKQAAKKQVEVAAMPADGSSARKDSADSCSEENKNDGKDTELAIPDEMSHAMFSIVAKEDCTVMIWSHEDMEELMERSVDMRAALTRAMTAAIVGKVVNFTVNTQNKSLPTWSTWLDHWKHNANVSDVQVEVNPQGLDTIEKESLPANLALFSFNTKE